MIWSVGRYDLGLAERDFWHLTLREFDALLKRRNANGENETYRAAFIVSAIYNVNRGKGQDPVRPEDFMAGKKKEKPTPESMLAAVKILHAKIGGKKVEE